MRNGMMRALNNLLLKTDSLPVFLTAVVILWLLGCAIGLAILYGIHEVFHMVRT